MYKKILLFFVMFLVIGVGCFALVERDNINNDLSTKLEQTEKSYSYRIDSMTAYQEGLVVKINELNEKNQKLKDSNSALQASYDELDVTYKQSLEDNKLHVDSLNLQIAEIRENIVVLENQISTSNSENTELKKQVAELKIKVANLEQSINEKNATIEQLNSTIETQKATIENLNKTITELNLTIEDLTNDLNSDLSSLTFYKNLMEGEVTEITAEDLAGVTKIRDYAFYECLNLTSVELPNSVTSVGESAFQNCYSLINIDLPYSLSDIGGCAFFDCQRLSELTLPKSLTSIGQAAFSGLSHLEKANYLGTVDQWCSIDFGNEWAVPFCNSSLLYFNIDNELLTSAYITAPKISDYAFCWYKNLTEVLLSDDVLNVGASAFYSCKNLITVDIQSSVNKISFQAFYNTQFLSNLKTNNDGVYTCSDGKKIMIEASSTSITESPDLTGVYLIADSAFRSCKSLTTIDISDVLFIGSYSFYSSGLTALTIPNGVTCLNDHVFGFTKISRVIIPSSVTSIADSAFYYCSNLTSVTIPSSVTGIGGYAFDSTPFLTNLQKYSNGIYTCSDGKKIMIKASSTSITEAPNLTGVYLIASSAFYNCDGLTSVTISSSVTIMGSFVFLLCDNITILVFEGTEPPLFNSETFGYQAYYLPKITSITVPAGSETAYEEALANAGITGIEVVAAA